MLLFLQPFIKSVIGSRVASEHICIKLSFSSTLPLGAAGQLGGRRRAATPRPIHNEELPVVLPAFESVCVNDSKVSAVVRAAL